MGTCDIVHNTHNINRIRSGILHAPRLRIVLAAEQTRPDERYGQEISLSFLILKKRQPSFIDTQCTKKLRYGSADELNWLSAPDGSTRKRRPGIKTPPLSRI